MKNIYYFLLLFTFSLFVSSCSRDEYQNHFSVEKIDVTNEWHLSAENDTEANAQGAVQLPSWNDATQKVEVVKYPALPCSTLDYSATTSGKRVYLVAEGESKLYVLDTQKQATQWVVEAELPAIVGSAPTIAVQHGAEHLHVYIAGTDSYAWAYNLTKKQWSKIENVPTLKGASAVALGKSHILYLGGEDAVATMFNTITKAWSKPILGDTYIDENTIVLQKSKNEFIIAGNHNYVASVDNGATFGAINWGVLLLYMFGMLCLGYYFMKRNNKNTDDFFKGGGRIPWWASGISLFATMLSAITFMAVPAKTFATDWRYFPMALTIMIMAFPVIKYYLPFFKKLNVTTAYEYLEARFNYTIRCVASLVFIVFMTARMAITLYLPSLALTTVTGIDIYLCIAMMGVITLIYSTIGGVEAVVWGDVIQGFILFGGAIFVVIYMLVDIPGGMDGVMQIIAEEEKMRVFDFSFNFTSATFWVIVLGGLANNLISYSSDQTVIQRYITTESEKGSANSIILNGILSVVASAIFYFIGTLLFAWYKTMPEQMNYAMENTDSIFPYFIMSELPAGIAGLIIAAIFAATMSTISSNINSLSTAYTVDLHRHFAKNITPNKELKTARISGLVMGSIGIGTALLMATLNILSIFDFFNFLLGLLSGGIAGLFFVGIFLPQVGSKATLLGFLLGTSCLFVISTFTPISFWLYGFIGLSLTVIFSLLFSLFFKNNKSISGFTWSTLSK